MNAQYPREITCIEVHEHISSLGKQSGIGTSIETTFYAHPEVWKDAQHRTMTIGGGTNMILHGLRNDGSYQKEANIAEAITFSNATMKKWRWIQLLPAWSLNATEVTSDMYVMRPWWKGIVPFHLAAAYEKYWGFTPKEFLAHAWKKNTNMQGILYQNWDNAGIANNLLKEHPWWPAAAVKSLCTVRGDAKLPTGQPHGRVCLGNFIEIWKRQRRWWKWERIEVCSLFGGRLVWPCLPAKWESDTVDAIYYIYTYEYQIIRQLFP